LYGAKAEPSEAAAEHFDPPGLFGTSMMPKVVEKGDDSTTVELSRPGVAGEADTGKVKAEGKSKEGEGGLLLPSHVLVDSAATGSGLGEDGQGDGDQETKDGSMDMEGLHFLGDDLARVSR
jgi:protein AIR1/2